MTKDQIDDLAERILQADLELGHDPPNAEVLEAITRAARILRGTQMSSANGASPPTRRDAEGIGPALVSGSAPLGDKCIEQQMSDYVIDTFVALAKVLMVATLDDSIAEISAAVGLTESEVREALRSVMAKIVLEEVTKVIHSCSR